MPESRFRLAAVVSGANLPAVRPVLEGLSPHLTIAPSGDSLQVDGELLGSSAQDLNRNLLSSMRRVEKRTRLRAEWTAPDGTRYRYFDYVLKQTTPP